MFMLVSDPEDPEADCEELGAASIDLNMASVLNYTEHFNCTIYVDIPCFVH